MRVKKFEAKSMKEALQMVKQELGPDAVILAARDNRKSFGLGGDASVEITAAVSEGTLQKKKFAESRMPQSTRDQFASADARTQRVVIEKMIEKRQKREEEERQAAARAESRKPITSVSYIDILDDEIEPTSRRMSALEKASGRNVQDLLADFEQEFSQLTQSAARAAGGGGRTASGQSRSAARAPASRAQVPRNQADVPAADEPGVADRAMARIRSAAREAWKNNPFMEEEEAPAPQPARPAQRRAEAAPASQQVSRQQAQQQSQQETQGYARGTAPGAASPSPAQSRTSLHAGSNGAAPQQANRGPSAGGLELVTDAFTEVPLHRTEAPPQQTVAQGVKEIASLKGEITRLQQMLEGFQKVPQTFTTMHPGADFGVGYDFSFMFQKLQEAGVSVDNSVEILKVAQREIDPVQAKKRPIVDAWVARWFLNNIQVNPTPFQGRLHLFVGGAGSGKTTTLVKMAAQLVVKEKKKVAILSTDSSKVGAVDQMKIYCQILNVPFAVIRNKADWEWVLGQLRNVDHVLVDFPGMPLKDLEEIHSLKALLPPEGLAPVTHLCVSATSKDADADEMAKRYKIAEPHDLVFTNLDQSAQHGIIYNLHRRTGLPLHSFGIGGRIPEDFEPASKERVLDLIFRLTKLKRGEA
jgi:flagellar biosynthesis protein FlhF